jgi:PIN domain nuclease of toxin-antitoxin system
MFRIWPTTDVALVDTESLYLTQVPGPITYGDSPESLAGENVHFTSFDRMLVAQAQVEGIPFVICDKEIQKYPIQILW